MKKITFSNPWINIVLGVLIITLAIVAYFLGWIETLRNYVIAFLMVYYAFAHIFVIHKKYNNRNARMIFTAQSVIVITLAVLLAIGEIVRVDIALGATLYLHGFTYLLVLQLLTARSTFLTFLVNIAVLTLGAYIFFTRPEVRILDWILIAILVGYGVFLLIFGIQPLMKTRKKRT